MAHNSWCENSSRTAFGSHRLSRDPEDRPSIGNKDDNIEDEG